MQTFFYDGQIRRFLLQFTRIFSGFQVQYGKEDGGDEYALLRVPVRYGDASRNAQTIIQENSRNSLPSTPLMTFYIAALDYDRPRMQEPYHVNRVAVRQRTYDETTDSYETTQGNAFTIERLMPVPYKMTLNLDIWTSNTNQKFQIFEQIATLFNPSLEVQSTDNYIDWTSLSVVELESTAFSSRTIPMGTENPIDICTLRFNLPIWISSPAKVKKLGVVERVIMSCFDSQGDANDAIVNNDLLLGTRQKITPFNYKLVVIDNQVQCLTAPTLVANGEAADLDPTSLVSNSTLLWPAVIDLYGTLRPGISQLRLERSDGTEIIGTITINPNDDRLVIFDADPDTTPQNTLPPIDAIIDPLINGPGSGLPPAAVGQRYLLVEGTGSLDTETYAVAWQGTNGRPLIAQANDIIEYDGQRWRVVFPAATQDATQYCTNVTTGIQYEFNGEFWQKSYQGVYPGGTWSLVL
jgi:hypothetical protein